ncbi:hypothetical protein D3C74_466010 [compost metagenome]
MQLQNRVQLIVRLIEQQLKFKFIDFANDTANGSGHLCRKLIVAFLISQLCHHRGIIIRLLQLLKLVYG